MISFFASGIPKGQPRPRAFARNFGGKWQARVFDAGTAEGWKSQIALAAKPFLPSPPLDGPVCLHIDLYLPRPKSHCNKKGLKPDAPKYHIGKPDADNHAKSVMDALTLIGMWKDDAQVANLNVRKMYCTLAGIAGAQISIALIERFTPVPPVTTPTAVQAPAIVGGKTSAGA